MSNIRRLISQEERSEQASLWVAKLERGLSAEEQAELQAWMALNPANEVEFLELAALWDQMDVLSKLKELSRHPGKRSHKKLTALAASVAAILAFGALLLMPARTTESPVPEEVLQNEIRYETPVGARSVVHLSDGSVIQLNTDTRLQVSMLPRERRLTLERGEIHVEVAHDPERPLRVIAEGRVMQAIGTSFNVRIDESHEVELIVTEGRVLVEVRAGHHSDQLAESSVGPTITKNQRVQVDRGQVKDVEVLEPDEIEVKLSWRDGNLIFRGESLSAAVSQVNRYTNVEFIIQSDALKQLRVAGLFKAGDVEGFLASLRANFNIVDERVDENTIRLSQSEDQQED